MPADNKFERMMKTAKQLRADNPEPIAEQGQPVQEEQSAAVETAEPRPAAQPITERKGRGRPAGKRSDSAYKPTTIFMRRELQIKANRLLEDTSSKQDLSDLIDQLLSGWVRRHEKAQI